MSIARPPSDERPGEGEEVARGVVRYAPDPPLAGTEGDTEATAMYAGESVGAIVGVEPATATVERFAAARRNS